MDDVDTSINMANVYFMRHCHLKVGLRISALIETYLLDPNKSLYNWTPRATETLERVRLTLPLEMLTHFLCDIPNSGGQYEFDTQTASLWIRAIINSVKYFDKAQALCTTSGNETEDFTALAAASTCLHCLVTMIPSSLWKLKSLSMCLDELRSNGVSYTAIFR